MFYDAANRLIQMDEYQNNGPSSLRRPTAMTQRATAYLRSSTTTASNQRSQPAILRLIPWLHPRAETM